jgi:hypothetical protein
VGNPHAGFDEAEAGDGLSGTAPAFDPTLEGVGVRLLRATCLKRNFLNHEEIEGRPQHHVVGVSR